MHEVTKRNKHSGNWCASIERATSLAPPNVSSIHNSRRKNHSELVCKPAFIANFDFIACHKNWLYSPNFDWIVRFGVRRF